VLAARHAFNMIDLSVGELLHETEVKLADLGMRHRQPVEDAIVSDDIVCTILRRAIGSYPKSPMVVASSRSRSGRGTELAVC
jgi:hypothetical protein